MRVRTLALSALALGILALPAFPAADEVKIKLGTANGQSAGTATFREAKGGKLDVQVSVHDLPAGVHGIHVHENASCVAPDFKSAGAHFDPVSHQHENLTVAEDGTATYRYELSGLSIGTRAPNDILLHGVSLVIHANPDDMKSDPTGNAGSRIACGALPSTGSAAPAQ